MGTEWVAVGLSVIAITVSVLAYRVARLSNPPVRWSAETSQGSHGVNVKVTNLGVARAREVEVSLSPAPPDRPSNSDARSGPQDVDRNASASVSYFRGLGDTPPSEVVVHWRRALWRRGTWRSPI